MAVGTVTSIVENGINLSVSVTIGGAIYTVVVAKSVFDSQLTNLDKQNYIISILTATRRSNRLFEIIYPTIIGSAITVPD